MQSPPTPLHNTQKMKYLFMAPPATGEMQPALAIAHALQIQDVEAEIFIASGSSFGRRWMPNPAKEPKSGLSRANPTESSAHADKKSSAELIPEAGVKEVKIHSNSYLPSLEKSASQSESSAFRFTPIDLGTTKDVEDYSHHMLRPSDFSAPSSLSFGSHKHERGNPIPFFDFWEEFAAGTEDERMNTIQKVLTIIDGIRPDMIVVDQIYATPFDGKYVSASPSFLPLSCRLASLFSPSIFFLLIPPPSCPSSFLCFSIFFISVCYSRQMKVGDRHYKGSRRSGWQPCQSSDKTTSHFIAVE